MDRVKVAVRDYIRRHRPRKRLELDHFAAFDTLGDAIGWAALGKDENGKRHPHQRRLTNLNLQHARYRLLGAKEQIQGVKSFEELLRIIHKEAGRIKGLGELYCYDVALRIGAHLDIYPEKVYLHAGTRLGAKAIGFSIKLDAIRTVRLSEALQELEPYEVEDLLCIYKDQLK